MADAYLLTSVHAFTAGALWLLCFLFMLNINGVNRAGNRWLGAFYGMLASSFTQLFLEGFGIEQHLLIQLLELSRWAMIPCFYMAISHFVAPAAPKKDWLLHFVPFLLFLVFSLVYLMQGLFHAKYYLPELPLWMRFVVRYFFTGQAIFYWFASVVVLRQHMANIQMVSSYKEKINLAWLKYMLVALLFLIVIRILGLFSTQVIYFSPLLYFAGVAVLAYLTLTQQSIYLTEPYYPRVEKGENNHETAPQKALHERLTPQQVDELKDIVVRRTTAEQLYLDPSLTLSVLSNKIGISTHELSYVLNNGLDKNFYQFINELRTEEAKTLLLSEDTKHLDMLGVATRAGFNSKTTFFTTFKKATGMTPGAYLNAKSKPA